MSTFDPEKVADRKNALRVAWIGVFGALLVAVLGRLECERMGRAEPLVVAGVVRQPDRISVSGAQVAVDAGGVASLAVTDDEGAFAFSLDKRPPRMILIVTKRGYRPYERLLPSTGALDQLRIDLEPERRRRIFAVVATVRVSQFRIETGEGYVTPFRHRLAVRLMTEKGRVQALSAWSVAFGRACQPTALARMRVAPGQDLRVELEIQPDPSARVKPRVIYSRLVESDLMFGDQAYDGRYTFADRPGLESSFSVIAAFKAVR